MRFRFTTKQLLKLTAVPGLLAGLLLPAAAQSPLPRQVPAQRLAPTPAISALHTDLRSRLATDLQLVRQVRQAPVAGRLLAPGTTLPQAFPQLRFAKDGQAIAVRVTARDVVALQPALAQRGFVVLASYPQLHFVEGMLPLAQLAAGKQGVEALAGQGLLGVLPVYVPRPSVGATTSQGDITLQTARVRGTRPRNLDGNGVRVGVISDSFNAQNGAAADIASGDLPAEGVRVLADDGETDEGRGMCQIVHDLAPGSGLAFATADATEGTFANHIRQLADPALGNCQVIVDDVAYFTEPFFQDGVIAQAVTEVTQQRGVTYFSSASNNADNSYENATPSFVTDNEGVSRLNFGTAAAPDFAQGFVVTKGYSLVLSLQWSDPFYTKAGVKTDLDAYLLTAAGDTVAQSTIDNVATETPFEVLSFNNNGSRNTNSYNLVIVRRKGTANPTRIKYINQLNGLPPTIVGPTEYQTNSGTIVGHTAAAEAVSVAAVPYYSPNTPEYFTAKGRPTILFDPNGNLLATPVVRAKPDLAAPDNVNTSSFATGSDPDKDGFPNFAGTSAAAPHAAGVAALLRQAEPGLTPAQVVARLIGTARPLGTGAGDLLTGAGLVDAFAAIYGPVAATAAPAVEDLEKGALPVSWSVNSQSGGRVQVITALNPASGKYHLLLDGLPPIVQNGTLTQIPTLNEAVWYLQGGAGSTALLTFRERRGAAETDQQMPAQFTGSSQTDGVALSVDGGNTWYRVFDLTGTNATQVYTTKTVNLSQFASANGLALGSDVRVKFQQYGAGVGTGSTASKRAGRVFDDIAVTGLTPAPVPLYSSGSGATAGCPGLQVQFTDSSLFKPTSYAWTFAGGTPASATTRNPLVTYNAPGRYPVVLSVSNANGSAARTDTGYVVVYGRAPQVTPSTRNVSFCAGGRISFSATAIYCPDTYSWSFPGGTPSSAAAANAGTVTYPTAGNYVATLTVANKYGSTVVNIPVSVSGRALPFTETFDNTVNTQTIPLGWIIVNPDKQSAWQLVDYVIGRNGQRTRAMRAPFWSDTDEGEHDALYTPSVNLAGATRPTLLFDLAYGKVSNTQLDSLSVQIADACTGTVLGTPYKKGSNGTLPTTSPKDQDIFTPTSGSQWRQESIDLTPYAGKSVVIRFIGRNGVGQYLYLDNVQVNGTLLALVNAAAQVGLEAWPNPVPAGTDLHLRLPAYQGSVGLRLVDALGRVVWQQQVQQTGAALERSVQLSVAPGLYNLVYTPASGPAAARRLVLE